MSLVPSLLCRYRSIGWLCHLLMITCLPAAINFAIIFVQNWKAASASGTHIVDGYEITICYFWATGGLLSEILYLRGVAGCKRRCIQAKVPT